MKMTKDKILKAIGTDAWDKIRKLAFGDQPAGDATEATLADGTQISYTGNLAVGTVVMVITEQGEAPIPDGDYEMEDGSTFTTKKGVVDTYTPADETAKGADAAGAPAKNPADLKQKIEAMRAQHQKNVVELTAIKKQFSAMQTDNKALRQSLSKISRVLEILVENTPEEPIRNRQFARNSAALSKADRIAALLKS
jgi:regulator of replication initiation timing